MSERRLPKAWRNGVEPGFFDTYPFSEYSAEGQAFHSRLVDICTVKRDTALHRSELVQVASRLRVDLDQMVAECERAQTWRTFEEGVGEWFSWPGFLDHHAMPDKAVSPATLRKRKARAAMTPEQRVEETAKNTAAKAKRRARRTPEEIEAERARNAAEARRSRRTRTPEQRAADAARKRKERARAKKVVHQSVTPSEVVHQSDDVHQSVTGTDGRDTVTDGRTPLENPEVEAQMSVSPPINIPYEGGSGSPTAETTPGCTVHGCGHRQASGSRHCGWHSYLGEDDDGRPVRAFVRSGDGW